jgi:DNA-binding NtrC family response regulator
VSNSHANTLDLCGRRTVSRENAAARHSQNVGKLIGRCARASDILSPIAETSTMTPQKLGRLLIVDDEAQLLAALCEILAEHGYETVGASSGIEGIKRLESERFDVVLTDLMMPGMDGLQFLKSARDIDPQLTGIVMTGQGSIPTAVEAMKVGAFDYLLKPFNLQVVGPVLARAMEMRRLRMENIRLREYVGQLTFESSNYRIVGDSTGIAQVRQLIEKTAGSDVTVLIRGDTGTGKELVARAIHNNSPRRERALVTINCAALQETLLESELFGHEKGAFTGAVQSKKGLVEVAEGGTLFIDEIAEMPPQMQAKLLRVLEDGHYRKVGGVQEYHADIRVIAATNKPLEDEIKAGRFREDLYYRLNVVPIVLPPLRDRPEDIPLLVAHFLQTRHIGRARHKVEPDAMRLLKAYRWPGNIRELANVIERAQILAEGDTIAPEDLPESMQVNLDGTAGAAAENPFNLHALEGRTVVAALQKFKGNKVNAAKALGVSRRALYRLLERHQIPQ